jgi:hypothetical protein
MGPSSIQFDFAFPISNSDAIRRHQRKSLTGNEIQLDYPGNGTADAFTAVPVCRPNNSLKEEIVQGGVLYPYVETRMMQAIQARNADQLLCFVYPRRAFFNRIAGTSKFTDRVLVAKRLR